MSDRLVTDLREIAASVHRGEVVNSERICRRCWQVVPLSTKHPHTHTKRPAESGSFHVGR